MIAAWEETLAVRDGVFLQLALLTVWAVWIYTALPRWQRIMHIAGILLFVALFVITTVNLWQPV